MKDEQENYSIAKEDIDVSAPSGKQNLTSVKVKRAHETATNQPIKSSSISGKIAQNAASTFLNFLEKAVGNTLNAIYFGVLFAVVAGIAVGLFDTVAYVFTTECKTSSTVENVGGCAFGFCKARFIDGHSRIIFLPVAGEFACSRKAVRNGNWVANLIE